MVWFKVDDNLAFHRKVVAAGNAAMGLWLRSGAWSAGQLTDGFIPTHMVAALGTRSQAGRLVEVGLWTLAEGGYQFHQWADEDRQPTRAGVLAERAYNARRTALHRDPALTEAVRARDQNRCRYCGVLVAWKDRRGGGGGTYDHVDPKGPNTLENLVVACRFCNSSKANESCAAKRSVLLPVGGFGGADSNVAGQAGVYLDPTQNGTRTELEKTKTPSRPVSTSSSYVGQRSASDQRANQDRDASRRISRPLRDEPVGRGCSLDAWKIVSEHAGDRQPRPPAARLAALGVEVDRLLIEDWPAAVIGAALDALDAKNLGPSQLGSVAYELNNSGEIPRNVYEIPEDQLTDADIAEILGPEAYDPDLPRSGPEDVKTRAALAAWRDHAQRDFRRKRRERAISVRRERLGKARKRSETAENGMGSPGPAPDPAGPSEAALSPGNRHSGIRP